MSPGRPQVSTALAGRLAERRAARRRYIAVRVAAALAVVALVGAGIWAVFYSPLLALDINQVVMSGVGTTVSQDQVTAVVAAQAGRPLPRVSTGDIEQQLLDITQVADVTVSRVWPRGLSIDIEPRLPQAAVQFEGGYALVDLDGVQVAHVAQLDQVPAGLPVIEVGLDTDDIPALQAAVSLLDQLPDHIRDQILSISASTRDDVRTVMEAGHEVVWGDDQRVALKAAAYLSLRELAPQATVFDVSSPDSPVTRTPDDQDTAHDAAQDSTYPPDG